MALCEGGAFLSILVYIGYTFAQDFGYEGSNGPIHWGEQYNTCFGKHQSPININLLSVKDTVLPPMEFVGFDDLMDNVTVANNGHTIIIHIHNEPQPAIVGGPLFDKYIFSQMHFHWGSNDTVGSEDKINSKSFPMELHMVFYKHEYGTATKALDHDDGLAVLAFFYEFDRHHHPAYDVVTETLSNVTEPETSISITHPFSLESILPYDLSTYFTYSGSLTTPPCLEIVTWIDFEQPIRISRTQIDGFRLLKSLNGPLTHNFRPVQPINDRTIFYNSDRATYYQNEITETKTEAPKQTPKDKLHKNSANNINIDIVIITALSLILLLIQDQHCYR